MPRKDIITSVSIALGIVIVGLGGMWALSLQSQHKASSAVQTMLGSVPQGASKIEDGAYSVSTSSELMWVATKPLLAGYTDIGTISISKGSVVITSGSIQSASFTIDMNSITVDSTGLQAGEKDLATHLKSSDFFDATAYPASTFVMTSITPKPTWNDAFAVIIHGNLTIKNITHPIDVPGDIYMKDGIAYAQGSVVLDRTKWDIRYGSKAFYAGLGDQVIDDHFTLAFKVQAKK